MQMYFPMHGFTLKSCYTSYIYFNVLMASLSSPHHKGTQKEISPASIRQQQAFVDILVDHLLPGRHRRLHSDGKDVAIQALECGPWKGLRETVLDAFCGIYTGRQPHRGSWQRRQLPRFILIQGGTRRQL